MTKEELDKEILQYIKAEKKYEKKIKRNIKRALRWAKIRKFFIIR